MRGLRLQQEAPGLDLPKDFLTKNREDMAAFLESLSQAEDEIRHWLQTPWSREPVKWGRVGLSLTVDTQGGLTPLVAGYKGVPPSLGPLHMGNEELVHETILLKDDSILGAELQTRAGEETVMPTLPSSPRQGEGGGSGAPY